MRSGRKTTAPRLRSPASDLTPITFDAGFERALQFVLRWEGGFVNHPADRGGATNRGITQRTYDQWRAQKNLPRRSVQELTNEELKEIYQGLYWVPGRCGRLPKRVGRVHFDACVNHGIGRAPRLLQRALNVPESGIINQATVDAAAAKDDATVALAYVATRREFYTQIVAAKPEQEIFLKGWLNRMDSLQKELEKE